jgi:predicted DNA-binding ribbon-helix-helix protein
VNDSLFNIAGGDADGEPVPSELRSLTEPMFKTVSAADGRHGIRLERAFWDTLDHLSAGSGKKRNAYVREIVERAQAEGINATSAVRSTAIDRLRSENERLATLSDTQYMVSMLQTSPSPSFALDRRKKLVRVNAEFVRYLRSIVGGVTGAVPVDSAQLTLDRPTEQIFAEAVAGMSIECGVSIRIDNRERRATARILVVPPHPANVLVGYMLS